MNFFWVECTLYFLLARIIMNWNLYLESYTRIRIESFTKLLNCTLWVISLKVYYFINLCCHRNLFTFNIFSDSSTQSQRAIKFWELSHKRTLLDFFLVVITPRENYQKIRKIISRFTCIHCSLGFRSKHIACLSLCRYFCMQKLPSTSSRDVFLCMRKSSKYIHDYLVEFHCHKSKPLSTELPLFCPIALFPI